MRLSASLLCHLAAPAALGGSIFVAGCATTSPPPAPTPTPTTSISGAGTTAVQTTSAELPVDFVPVARAGRYTLVELVPQPAQRDLLRQVVEVAIPLSFDASVGDALRHVLRRTGYRLCDAADAAPLYALPLPAAHLRLGPLPLRDALLALAGPAWELSIDDATRQVCFARHRTSATEVQAAIPAAPDPAPRTEPQEVQP
ncbi:PilL N-terminal domain-containing protein [Paucibacter sp. O1-1]|nr:PilL N-terminal domain-containing protein [Paucibacter sp. O1-1]MDA3826060.1 PilL N-terminal domain-containing protein [Paucibacter sp. O1-1]